MNLELTEDLTNRNKCLVELNEEKVNKYEARTQATILPTLVEVAVKVSLRMLQRSTSIQELANAGQLQIANFRRENGKQGCGLVTERKR